MAIFNIYDLGKKTDLLVTASEQECIDKSQILLATTVADTARVFIFEELNSRDDYYDMCDQEDVSRDGGYTLKNFIKLSGLETKDIRTVDDAWEKVKGPGALEYENLHHLAPDEQEEVVKWLPDELLVQELLRRLKEYRGASDGVIEVFDHMKIYV